MDSPPKGVSKGVGRRRLVQRESLLAQLDRLEGEPRQAPEFARVWTPGTQLKVDFYTSREAARLAGMTPRERAQRGALAAWKASSAFHKMAARSHAMKYFGRNRVAMVGPRHLQKSNRAAR